MDLDEFSDYLETIHRRFLELCPADPEGPPDLQSIWEETAAALGTSLEEIRVVDEELRRQNIELERLQNGYASELDDYRALFDLAPDAYIATDLFGTIRLANRAASRLMGIQPRFLVGKPLFSLIFADDRRAFRTVLSRLNRTGRLDGSMIRIQPRSRPMTAVSIDAEVVSDPEGVPTSCYWILRPVRTATESSFQAPREAPAPRKANRGTELIAWEIDPSTGSFVSIGTAVESVLGYPASRWEEPGFWNSILHDDDRPLAEAHRQRCLREGGGEVEYRLRAADGRFVWFRESATEGREGPDQPSRMRGFLWDISRRKKFERRLYTDRRNLAEELAEAWHLYRLAGHLLASLDPETIVQEVLSAILSILGAEMGTIRLREAESGAPELVASVGLGLSYLERFGRGMIERDGPGPVIVEDVAGDPSTWAEASQLGGFRACTTIPLIGRGGEPLGAVTAYFAEPHRPSPRHLHAVEQYALPAVDALENSRRHRSATESVSRKGVFLATLAHELRNPLGAIRACAEMLRIQGPDNPGLAEMGNLIARQVRHMTRLVEDTLDATRLARGAIVVRKERVDLVEVAARAMEEVQPQIEARGHELFVDVPDRSLILDADPLRMEQVLSNLLTNAAKYTDPGGRIELAIVRENSQALIRVRDSGIGLTPEALAGVFQLFRQEDASISRSGGGLGIGLALVKSLVELHGGTVHADSDGPGHGSEFCVRLPIDGEERSNGDAEGG